MPYTERDTLVSRGPQKFTESELTRALKAARKAGIEVARFEIDNDGKRIVVFAGKATDAGQEIGHNPWDSVLGESS